MDHRQIGHPRHCCFFRSRTWCENDIDRHFCHSWASGAHSCNACVVGIPAQLIAFAVPHATQVWPTSGALAVPSKILDDSNINLKADGRFLSPIHRHVGNRTRQSLACYVGGFLAGLLSGMAWERRHRLACAKSINISTSPQMMRELGKALLQGHAWAAGKKSREARQAPFLIDYLVHKKRIVSVLPDIPPAPISIEHCQSHSTSAFPSTASPPKILEFFNTTFPLPTSQAGSLPK
jgi:hypothetical protein